jgi:enediyne biosynthesis protein E4
MMIRVLRYSLFIVSLIIFKQIVFASGPPITLSSLRLNTPPTCSDSFISHDLDHTTSVTRDPVGYYDSNGAGLAINDLNNDGYLEIVLANLIGGNTILWNRGNLQFETEVLESHNPSRMVNIIDVDGDGWLDIVFSQQPAAPRYWRNQQNERFVSEILPGVSYSGYALNWMDMDADGDLDLITGSYDMELMKLLGQTRRISGVVYYENQRTHFVPTRLASESNTLAIIFNDVDGDSQPEVIVGNDFALKDQYFSYSLTGWQELDPLQVMPHSTMSYATADIDNNGQLEMFAVDMKPNNEDADTLAAWQPVMQMMMAMPHVEGDPQIMENVLYKFDHLGTYTNVAPELDLDATGWSWSTKFGDLDNDGFQDLYVVNGMISVELFSHLPNNELVEENQVFRNVGGEQFQPMYGWGLNSTRSGRGMSMADLDNDGDLDIVVNNLLSPAQVFENRLCAGSSLEVDLFWPASQNTRAIGARLSLHTSLGTYTRDVYVASGYLSGDPARVHFGFPEDAVIQRLEIRWPDDETTVIHDLQPGTLVQIERG